MLWNYLKIATKVLLRRKFFTFISLFGICFTLTVLMIATAVLDHMVGPHAPESNRGRTLALYYIELQGEKNSSSGPAGYAFLEEHVDYLRQFQGVEQLTYFSGQSTVTSFVDGRKIDSMLKRVDGQFWRVFDFEFLEGVPFGPEAEEAGDMVAVINETTRQRFFGDGAKAEGREITADDQTFRVIGVVRDVAMIQKLPFAEMWVPISTAKSTAYRQRYRGNFRAAVLLEDRSHFKPLKDEFESRMAGAVPQDRNRYDTVRANFDTPLELMSRFFFDEENSEARPGALLTLIVGAMVLFMVLPTLNLINLNLSRIMERASEIGVRRSFGASARTLVGQFVVENVVLTLIGGAIGLVMSGAALAMINRIDLIPYAHFGLNFRIFGYGLALALFFGLFSGVYPAWKMSRLHPVEALQGRPS